ncbi:hypothetical protein LMK08_01035 [Metapseudomonas furukawaii]|jgi:hypothetical protein|uniref:hypothetical protein n=1 Tax=Metapseudomonas furukawaii TaxID=1149133 RepID=UPI00227CEC62|nr:hypothetical protein [Pseudomonas furukawaii]WAG79274.1 hypothetical protein LMK08_01035 [Pseudomonas furukawaii]
MKVVEQEFMTTARRMHGLSVRSRRVNSISRSLLGLQGEQRQERLLPVSPGFESDRHAGGPADI